MLKYILMPCLKKKLQHRDSECAASSCVGWKECEHHVSSVGQSSCQCLSLQLRHFDQCLCVFETYSRLQLSLSSLCAVYLWSSADQSQSWLIPASIADRCDPVVYSDCSSFIDQCKRRPEDKPPLQPCTTLTYIFKLGFTQTHVHTL